MHFHYRSLSTRKREREKKKKGTAQSHLPPASSPVADHHLPFSSSTASTTASLALSHNRHLVLLTLTPLPPPSPALSHNPSATANHCPATSTATPVARLSYGSTRWPQSLPLSNLLSPIVAIHPVTAHFYFVLYYCSKPLLCYTVVGPCHNLDLPSPLHRLTPLLSTDYFSTLLIHNH
ncbi:hypothetical protein BHM03_00004548 [Ensete ventricosum]|nr:hypothetical protein BHM03_00004548 [Ensete ventricosum]